MKSWNKKQRECSKDCFGIVFENFVEIKQFAEFGFVQLCSWEAHTCYEACKLFRGVTKSSKNVESVAMRIKVSIAYSSNSRRPFSITMRRTWSSCSLCTYQCTAHTYMHPFTTERNFPELRKNYGVDTSECKIFQDRRHTTYDFIEMKG